MLRLVPALLLLSACVTYIPPGAPAPREATEVAAAFDRTWNATIDVFADRVIAIETLERASGLVVASSASIPGRTKADSTAAIQLADCGREKEGFGSGARGAFLPQRAKYNVRVRERGAATTVQVTSIFTRSVGSETIECASRGAFEQAFESAVKARAEAR